MTKQFQFKVDLETLLGMDGIDGLNNHLDDAMSAAGLTEMATDIAYKVIGLEGETIIVEATYTPEVDEFEIEEPTRVMFLVDTDKDSLDPIFAYFPDEEFAGADRVCYSHVGQHASCSPAYAKQCKKATPEQYAALKRELEGEGYNLEIID
jgi:hypothetical protein